MNSSDNSREPSPAEERANRSGPTSRQSDITDAPSGYEETPPGRQERQIPPNAPRRPQNMVHRPDGDDTNRANNWARDCLANLKNLATKEKRWKEIVRRQIQAAPPGPRAERMVSLRNEIIQNMAIEIEKLNTHISGLETISTSLSPEDEDRLRKNRETLENHISGLDHQISELRKQISIITNDANVQNAPIPIIPSIEDDEEFSELTPVRMEHPLFSWPRYMTNEQNLNVNEADPSSDSVQFIGTCRANEHRIRPTVKPVDIPKFDGNMKEWQNFWNLFQTLIHKSKLPTIEKINYLRQSLTGEAAIQLSSFPTTEASYESAVNYLLELYDTSDEILLHLMRDFVKLQPKSHNEKDILTTMDSIAGIFRQTNNKADDLFNALGLVILHNKTPANILNEVYRSIPKGKNPSPSELTDSIRQFLRRQSKVNSFAADHDRSVFSKQNNFPSRAEKTMANKPKTSAPVKTSTCFLCKGNHAPWNCTANLSRKDKMNALSQEKRCGLCLRKNHNTNECKSKRSCAKCDGKHHEIFCTGKNKDRKVNLVNTEEAEQEYTVQFSATQTVTNQYDSALLPVGKIKIIHQGQITEIAAVLDCGSDTSFIDETLASQLELPVLTSKKIRLKTFGATSELMKMKQVETNFDSIEATPITTKLWTKRVLTGPLQTIKFTHSELNGVHTSSHETHITPKVLIGSDLMWSNLIEIKQLNDDYTLVKTKIGNFITGKASPRSAANAFSVITGDATMKIPIWNKLFMEEQKEFSGTEKAEKVHRDKVIQENFQNTIERREDGYYVAFPWKDNLGELPDNKALAQRRFTSLVLNLAKNPKFLEQYHTIITEQLELGVIEKAPNPYPTARVVHYIAHQAVATPLKDTTKLRIVYDASGHYQNKPSLNDTIHQGPLLLPSLTGINLRFRCGKYAVIADVQKAFLQVRLLESERDATRFFWLRDITKPITPDNVEVYRFTRVPFGINASPFLLGATMRHHLEKCSSENLLANLLRENLYVDNILLSTNDHNQLLNWLPESKEIFSGMKMKLREFISNSKSFNQALTEAETNATTSPKVLGMTWNTVSDQWNCRATVPSATLTKRGISQAVASIYDPMGWICPALLPLRKFLQSLWNDLLDWDTPLSQAQQEEWKALVQSFGSISKDIARALPESPSGEHVMITCSDASGYAVGLAIYVAPEDLSTASLVFAKSKLHSKSASLTIPKAEMSALAKGVANTLITLLEMKNNISIKKVIIFSDSEIALAWIKHKPDQKTTGVFVQNRIKEIQKNAELIEQMGVSIHFGYINTKDNPADIATRGCSSTELCDHFWWNPQEQLTRAMRRDLFSLENPPLIHVNMVLPEENYGEEWLENCDTWEQALQKRISETHPLNEVITARHYIEAEKELLYFHQNGLLTRLSAAQRQDLRPLLRDNLWVCRGRMSNADLEEETKFPILILPKTPTAKLLIRQAHSKYHKSVAHTMADVRQRFWIPQLRSQTIAVTRKCVECQKMNNRPYIYPPSGDLPSRRLTQSTPFQHTGVDYFGPLNTQDGNTWGCIYTCTVTRLIHLEIISDLTATSFINCLRKIWGRRGVPQSITSDNASTFELGRKIADKVISLQQDHRTQNVLAHQKITWHNITPYAPWQGGFYERLIRSVKTAMYKNLKHIPTREELSTVLIECEAVINSRPLTYVGTENDSNTILRPIDFIHKNIKLNVEIDDKDDDEEYCNHPALRTQLDAEQAIKSSYQQTSQFWETWRELYVKELRASHKHTISSKKAGSSSLPIIGQVVLIHDNMQPRHKWNIGRILAIQTSKDGSIREVTLRSETGRTLSRPVNLLYPLEIPDDELPPSLQLTSNSEEEPSSQRPSSNTRKQPRRWYGSTDSLIYVMCLLMLMITPISAQHALPSIRCSPTGVITSGDGISQQQLCLAHNCVTLLTTGAIHLNAADIVTDYAVTWTFLLNGTIHNLQQYCQAGSFCKTVNCTFCMAAMLNPSCWPWTSIILIILFTYMMTAICYGILYTPWIIGKPIRLWFHTMYRALWYCFSIKWRRQSNSSASTPRSRTRNSIIPLIAIVLLLSTCEGCQNINFVHSDSTKCSEDQCHIESNIHTVISPYTQESCLQLSQNEDKIAFLRLQWLDTRYTCETKTLYWTRNTSPKVWDSKRCPHTGSCTQNKCLDFNSTSLIPELQPANSFPGITHCVESCGGPGCGCFYPSSGCLFYRTYLKSNSDTLYQTIECESWTPTTRIQLTHTSGSQTRVYNMTLIDDTPVTADAFTLQLTGLSTPIIPVMQQRFIQTSTDTAILTQATQLQCPTSASAVSLKNCSATPDCKCSPAEDAVKCDCKEDNAFAAFQNIHRKLPLVSPTYSLVTIRNQVVMKIKRNTMAEVLLTIKGTFNTSATFTNTTCSIPDSTISGCYNCQQGAQTTITCTAPTSVMAAIQCGKTAFMAHCGPHGTQNSIRLSQTSATPNINCSFTCGTAAQVFHLTGVLYYVNDMLTLHRHYIEANHSTFHETTINFPWPDLQHIFDIYQDWMKEIIICAGGTLAALCMLYVVISRYSLQASLSMLRMIIRCATLPFLLTMLIVNQFTSRRRKSHIFIVMILLIGSVSMSQPIRALQHACASTTQELQQLRNLSRSSLKRHADDSVQNLLRAIMSLETAKRSKNNRQDNTTNAAALALKCYVEIRNFLNATQSDRLFHEYTTMFDTFGTIEDVHALAKDIKDSILHQMPLPLVFTSILPPSRRREDPSIKDTPKTTPPKQDVVADRLRKIEMNLYKLTEIATKMEVKLTPPSSTKTFISRGTSPIPQTVPKRKATSPHLRKIRSPTYKRRRTSSSSSSRSPSPRREESPSSSSSSGSDRSRSPSPSPKKRSSVKKMPMEASREAGSVLKST